MWELEDVYIVHFLTLKGPCVQAHCVQRSTLWIIILKFKRVVRIQDVIYVLRRVRL
jgi:hypothetical protein